ncbi:MAG: nucleoside kinase [Peptococcaceae bacterium]|nr:nucleoside kinase [Peptococcaceae bacterium]
MTALELKDTPGKKTVKVNISGSGVFEMPAGARAEEAMKFDTAARRTPVVAVKLNNSLEDLKTGIIEDCTLEFVDLECEEGMRIYQNGLILVLTRAAQEVFPESRVIVEHSLANAIYGEIKLKRALKIGDIELIEKRMRSIINGGGGIERIVLTREEAARLFRERGMKDKVDLLDYWHSPQVEVIRCGDCYDYAMGPCVPDLNVLKVFRLRFYLPGFILELPRPQDPLSLPVYIEQGRLANIFFEADKWEKTLHIRDVVSLNRILEKGDPGELIRVAEAFQEKKISQIADMIRANIDRTRIVLIAGPSSSGKTTFSKRLSVQLKVNGINPVAVSLDDYFVDREKTPLDEKGQYDFESLDAIDRELFNEHLIKLIQGEEIELPYYNFKTGLREYRGDILKLGHLDLIVIEGIHGLNDRLTASIPKGRKFKIYVSALTHLSLDNQHRIHTTDLRLLRRIVRDHHHRGYTAEQTLERWPMVRRGEERNIFPFQEEADIMFNSALVYELAVLKGFAEPLLQEITRESPMYSEARRLLKILSFFNAVHCDDVPSNSIIREFIGQSCFYR